MPPKENDILKDLCIGWTTREGEVVGKVKHSALSTDGFTCEIELTDIKKEKKMNKLQGKNIDKIEIRRYGDNVVAKAYSRVDITDCSGHVYDKGWSLVEEASATCGPNDIFDFNIGAKLALDRLYEGYDMTPKPKRKPYNGLIYIHHYPGCGLLDNAVYRVFDGKIKGCWYHGHPAADPYIFSDMTDDQLSRKIQIDLFGSDDPSAKVIAYFVHNDKTKA